jgi:hypothetical protein
MKVQNMTSSNGNKIANQFIIEDENKVVFQSYDSIICKKEYKPGIGKVITLDSYYWNYSKTTSKYRNIFLNETTKETEVKIKQGIYKLDDLN